MHKELAMTWRSRIAAALAAAAISGMMPMFSSTSVRALESTIELKIPERRNWTASVASRGEFAIVVWVATATDGTSDLYAVTSTDGGATFSAPRRVNDIPGDVRTGGEYAPRVAVGPDQIHLAWMSSRNDKVALRVAKSSDRGQTFTPASTLHEEGLVNGRGWQSIGLGPDGTLHAAWLDGRNDEAASEHAGHGAAPGRPAMHGGKMDLFYGALKPTSPTANSQMLSADTCQCCKTALAVGADGSINVAWRQIFGDSIRDIAFRRADARGGQFGEPVRVSVDNWLLNGCPDDGPVLAADRTSGVHVAWPTLVAGGAEERIGLFYAYSSDGKTFTPRVEVKNLGSLKPSHIQMTSRSDGRLGIVWDELSDGVRKIVMATGAPGAGGAASLSSGQLVSDPAVTGTYPSVAPAPSGFLVAWTSGVADASTIKVARVSDRP
jgi:hypothetical protein